MFKTALEKAKINKVTGIHGLQHSFATYLMEYVTDTKLIKELMGNADIKTTMRYLHMSNQNIKKIIIPLDKM